MSHETTPEMPDAVYGELSDDLEAAYVQAATSRVTNRRIKRLMTAFMAAGTLAVMGNLVARNDVPDGAGSGGFLVLAAATMGRRGAKFHERSANLNARDAAIAQQIFAHEQGSEVELWAELEVGQVFSLDEIQAAYHGAFQTPPYPEAFVAKNQHQEPA